MAVSVSTHIVQTLDSLNLNTCKATVTVSEKSGSVNVADNTSIVTISFSVVITSNRTFTGTSRPKAGYLYITVNGVEEWWTIPFPSGAKLGTVLRSESYEQTITHSADGSKTIGYSCYMDRGTDDRNYNVIWEKTGTDSSTLKLSTIPRASKATVSPNPLILSDSTNTLTVSTNRAASGFTHTVKATVGSFSETKTGVGASTTFSIPKTLISEMTGTSLNGTIETTTYNGSTQIGSKTTTSFTVEVDTSQEHAELTSYTLSDTNPATNPYTDNSFIYNASDLQAVLNIGVVGSNTQLAKAVVSLDGVIVTYSLSGTTSQITFTKNKVTGTNLSVALTDARGHVENISIPLTVIPYEPVTVTSAVVTRVNSNGDPSDTGNYLSYTIKGTAFSGSFGAANNSAACTYEYKTTNTSTYTAGTETAAAALSGSGQIQAFTITGMTGEEFPSVSEMDVRFTVADLFSQAVSGVVRVHEGLPVYGWGRDHFDVYGQFHIHDRADAAKYISLDADNPETVEVNFSGAVGGKVRWTVFKFGVFRVAACKWRSASNVTVNSSWNGFYTTSNISTPNFPLSFSSVSHLDASYVASDANARYSADCWLTPQPNNGETGGISGTNAGTVFLVRPDSGVTIGHPVFSLLVIGTI